MTAQGKPFALLAQIMAFFCIQGFSKRIRFGLENLFPRTEVMQREFGAASGRKRALFYPGRLFKTVVIFLGYLFSRIGLLTREFCKRFF
jgi:hypothetical protein